MRGQSMTPKSIKGDRTTRFRLSDSIPYHLYRVTEALVQEKREELRPHGITVSQWRILSTLRSEEVCTIGAIASYTAMKQPVISRIIGEMEQAELIRRTVDQADMRVVSVSLTAKGEKLFDSLMLAEISHRTKVLAGLTRDDIQSLWGILKKMEGTLGLKKI
jgi:DNA-binding MarR family transcriptional regulator